MERIGLQDIFVGRARRKHDGNFLRGRLLAHHNMHARNAAVGQLVELVAAHNTLPVNAVEHLNQMNHIFIGHSLEPPGSIVLTQRLDGPALRHQIGRKIGLDEFLYTIALTLELSVGLINRKIIGCNQLSVLPRTSHFILITKLVFTRQTDYHHQSCNQYNRHFEEAHAGIS